MSFTPRNHTRPFVHTDHKSEHCDNRSDGYNGVLAPTKNPKSNDETVDYINSEINEDEVKSTNSITDTLHE